MIAAATCTPVVYPDRNIAAPDLPDPAAGLRVVSKFIVQIEWSSNATASNMHTALLDSPGMH